MVTRETSYIGQLYFGLSTDDPTEVEWHNGDRILVMDQDQMLVYDEAAATFKSISMGGGGGGGGSTIVSKTITANGTYYASADSADGYNPVIVNVPASSQENFVFKLKNSMGVGVTFVSFYYDTNVQMIIQFIYAFQSAGDTVQKTCLNQNGKIVLGWTYNKAITSVTYNGTPLTFNTSGSASRRYITFDAPDNYDIDIPIEFS